MEFKNKIEKGKNLENPLPGLLAEPAHPARPRSPPPFSLAAWLALSAPPRSPTLPSLAGSWARPIDAASLAHTPAPSLCSAGPTRKRLRASVHNCHPWAPPVSSRQPRNRLPLRAALAKLPLLTPFGAPVHAHPLPAASLLSPEPPSPRAHLCSLVELLTLGISHGEAAPPSLTVVRHRHRHQKLRPS